LGCNSYCFPSIRLKNVSVKFWLLFWAWTSPVQARTRQSLKPDPDDSILHPKHTYTIWGAVLIIFRQYDWKMLQSNFDDCFGAQTPSQWARSMQSWKSRHDESVFHPKHTRNVSGAVIIAFGQYSWKMFRSNFHDFSGVGHHRSKIVQEKLKTGPRWLCFAPDTMWDYGILEEPY